MSTFQERLDKAADSTTCQILSAAGSSLVGFGAWNLAAGGAGLVPITLGGAALLASNYACEWDPNGTSTLPEGNTNIVAGSCLKTEGCDLLLEDNEGRQWNGSRVKELKYIVDDGTYPNGTPRVRYAYVNCDDEVITNYSSKSLMPVTTKVADGGVCVGDPAPPPGPIFPPYEYTEPGEGGCSLTVNVLGWGQNPDGTVAPIYKIEPSAAEGRSGGGRIGGCNFEPVVYYQPKPEGGGPGGGGPGGGGGEPPYTIPFVDGGPEDDPDWLKLLKQALATAAGNLLAEAIKSLLDGQVAAATYEMTAPCDVDDEGQPLKWTGEIPAQDYQPAVLDRLDAISNQLSQHLLWKTPICIPEPTQVEGDFRTISFRSDETSPYGKSRLRKRLRYRSLSGLGLDGLIDYWKSFTFESGPYRVRWTGGAWGTVEVWAASEAEGKRVIQHAAGEAGSYALETGGWSTRVSSSTRLGVRGTMRVDTTKGFYWITERDGSDNRPIVATWPDQ